VDAVQVGEGEKGEEGEEGEEDREFLLASRDALRR